MYIGQCLHCVHSREKKKTNIGINNIQKYKIYTKFQDIILLITSKDSGVGFKWNIY